MTERQQNASSSVPAAGLQQEQFLDVISKEEATRRFQQHLTLSPLGEEEVLLEAALGRVLAQDIISNIDVPAFDRSNVDGFALQAYDTYSAAEETPRLVRLNNENITPGQVPQIAITAGTATPVATGAIIPRGADAVIMIEETDFIDGQIEIHKAVTPGQNVTFAGTDIANGETVIRRGQLLTSREIGVLAALGIVQVSVYRKPRVAIISTGNEIVSPGQPLLPGTIYDSNASLLAAAVTELGGEPLSLGVIPDDEQKLADALQTAKIADVILLSGGTSKGAGDLSYRAVSELGSPGIVAHGVALKPGKPICLAVAEGKPVVVLPGFPTSAIFTFHEFVAPVIRAYSGIPAEQRETVTAEIPVRIHSDRGRTEYLLVGLIQNERGYTAYPMGKGSGAVTTFSLADGFITIPAQTEQLEAGSTVSVQRLGKQLQPADLVVIGSHCIGLDMILSRLHQRGITSKFMAVGSTGGLTAAQRGECDIAGVHLMDPSTGIYNTSFLTPGLELISGYQRLQGIVYRTGDERFMGKPIDDIFANIDNFANSTMINRNAGSGTRILIDRRLKGKKPPGYTVQAKSHNAVAVAVEQGRADWGLTIAPVASRYHLEFVPVQAEQYDFIIPQCRLERPAVQEFRRLLDDPQMRSALREIGLGA
ncbi:MAG: molybdopterin biosynthesis protein [Planctomycetota bacterium]|nr:molybdopterin biosynthesis protein [Planctomycetota bacterium]